MKKAEKGMKKKIITVSLSVNVLKLCDCFVHASNRKLSRSSLVEKALINLLRQEAVNFNGKRIGYE